MSGFLRNDKEQQSLRKERNKKEVEELKRLGLLFIIVTIFLAACGQKSADPKKVIQQSWTTTVKQSKGKEVRLYMWGGDQGINRYIDDWVKPKLEEKYSIHLKRVPMDTPDILKKIDAEKRAGKKNGTVDIIWLNGENFKNAKKRNLLVGDFTNNLPNYRDYYDTDSLALNSDFGQKVEGLEAPWGKVQFVFNYDAAKIKNPPHTLKELDEWIQSNPGKFTYPEAEDFTGNAFLRHLFYASAGDPKKWIDQPFNEEFADEKGKKVWSRLKNWEKDLWRQGETYPRSLTELDRLYSKGDILMTMGYNEARAEHLMDEKVFPKTTKSFVLDDVGSIGNTHFLTIPFNSPNPAAAMMAINFMLSPQAQLEKLKPTFWGESSPIDYNKLTPKWKEKFAQVKRGMSVPTDQQLTSSFVPEASSKYVEWMQANWRSEFINQ